MATGRWKELLWPFGGTVLGIFLIPVAIAQYPDFVNANRWLLPSSVVVVAICWIVPLARHKNIVRMFQWILTLGGGWIAISVIVCLMAILTLGLGCIELFRFHEQHLAKV